MNILLVSATSAEIAPSTEYITSSWQQDPGSIYTRNGHRLQILISGVGMTATTYSLTRTLQGHPFDLVLQAGIGGSFDRDIPLGSVVQVLSEVFADLGAEDHYNFLDIFDLELADPEIPPFSDKRLAAPQVFFPDPLRLPGVSGLSVNMGSGSSFTATARLEKYHCQTESMEGAAFHYVCLNEQVPFAQIRAISNYAEARDKSKWKIGEAITNLNNWLITYLQTL